MNVTGSEFAAVTDGKLVSEDPLHLRVHKRYSGKITHFNYNPQTKLREVMFSQTPVIPSTWGGGLYSSMQWTRGLTPPRQTPLLGHSPPVRQPLAPVQTPPWPLKHGLLECVLVQQQFLMTTDNCSFFRHFYYYFDSRKF